MIDLHLHLDGSIPADDIIKIALKHNIELPHYDKNKISEMISVDLNCKSLNEYLKCFDIPILILQQKETIKEAVESLVKKLYKSGIIYAEIRFAPQLSTKKGLSQNDVVEAAIDGLNSAINSTENFFDAKLILCCMRGKDKENFETLEVCSKFLNKGVAALDLAGAEALFKTENYKSLFEQAKKRNIPFTIHAGEADGAESIKSAINFGAKRIGHGVRVIEDKELLRQMINDNIVFEMCPTSNVQTKAVKSIKEHPVKKLLDMGARVCVNTDNMIVSKTDIFNEFNIIEKELGITKNDKIQLLKNSVYGAFTDEKEKLLKAMSLKYISD